jgi:geranylgeranyl pyrophosphate synthase
MEHWFKGKQDNTALSRGAGGSELLQNDGVLAALERTIASAFGLSNKVEEETKTDRAYRHHFETVGRQMRPKLAISASKRLELCEDDAVLLAAGIEALHNASLVQDDMQDGALTRRDRPSVHNVFGPAVALSLTNRLIASAMTLIADASQGKQLVAAVNRAIQLTCEGQTRDLDPDGDHSVDGLMQTARLKSGPLFALSLELPLIAANHRESLATAHDAACRFGLGYQIFDDLKDREVDRLQVADANIVNALAREFGEALAMQKARELAEADLIQSVDQASKLPMGSGAALVELSNKLRANLVENSG